MSVFDFYVPQLNTDASGQLLRMNQLDASMVAIGSYDAAYKIDLKQSVAREIFRFSVYNSTLVVDDLETTATAGTLPENSDRDVGFYIQSLKFPTASPNYATGAATGGSAAPLNPLLASAYVGHLAASTIDDNNVVTIAQEYMSHVAKSLFTTAKATAIFNNESDFIRKTANQTPVVEYYKRLYDMSGAAVVDGVHINTLSTAEITTDTGKDVANGVDVRSRNSLARNLFYNIAAKDISRVTGILATTMDAATKTYPIPVLAGDTFNSFVTIQKHANQAVEVFGAGSTTAIPDRKYRIVLNIVADNVTPNYDLDFQRATNFTQVSSWPIAGIEELNTPGDAVSLA